MAGDTIFNVVDPADPVNTIMMFETITGISLNNEQKNKAESIVMKLPRTSCAHDFTKIAKEDESLLEFAKAVEEEYS